MSENLLYPLTLPQQNFYYDYLLHKNHNKYNMGGSLVLNGDLDIDLFRKSYNYIIQKYDVLRHRLVIKDGEPFQMFLPEYQCDIEYRDLRNNPNPFEEAMLFVVEEIRKPFPFENVNLYSEMILQTGDKQFIWFTRFHHFSNDGYGRSVINQAISDTYNSLLSNGDYPEIKSYSYLDFLDDDLIYRESESFKDSSEFWRKKLLPLPEPLDFTSKKNTLKNLSLHNERITLNLHRMCYSSMLKIADQLGITPFQALLGILYTTLYKLYNKNDIIIGMPVLNRSNHKFRNTPGLFMNMMPLRLRLEAKWTFTDILKAIKAELKECYRHQRLPINETIRHFRNDPEFNNELFDVTIVYRKMDFSQKFGKAKLHTVTLDTQLRNESLGLEIDEYDDEENVNIFFNYNPLIFSEKEIVQFARCFEAVLFDLIYFPEKSISDVNFLSEFEQYKITKTLNPYTKIEITDNTIISQFEKSVKDYPGNISIINNDESLNYNQLNSRVNQIANYLIDNYNISKGEIVCLATERSIDAVAAMIGIMKTGAVCLPLDNNNPVERIKYILENSGSKILIASEPEHKGLTDKVIYLSDVECRKYSNPKIEIKPNYLAYVINTSGSTGVPKGVMIEHRSFMNMFVNTIVKFGVTENDRILQFASLGFDAAVFEIFQALLTGATLVIADKEIIHNPTLFIRYMDHKKITVATFPPAFLSALDKPEFPHLQTLITAGEPAILSDVNYYKQFKKYINAYGPTEASVCASYYIAEKEKDYKDNLSIGKTIPGSKIYILNDNLDLLPIGFPGELCIAGLNLARGYLNNKELTEKKFISCPFDEQLRMYRTGDKARLLPDGNIEFLGRIDEQVKIRGNRIELGEIETRLKKYPLIKDAVVLDIGINKNKDIAAFFSSDEEIDIKELKKFLCKFLPEYMIPQHFILIDKIPLTLSGKINKIELQKFALLKSNSSNERLSEVTELEKKLIPIFEKVLNYSPIGIYDNFFELGGESLKIARLITQIKKEFHLEISFKRILDNPTVRGVATELEVSNYDAHYEIQTTPAKEYYPTSHSQKRLWFLSQDKENAAAYNMPVPFLLEGDLNYENLKKTINTIVDRHEALRTIFIEIDNTLYQKVLATYDSIVTEYDFILEKNAEEKTVHVINKEVMTAFDLSSEIPIRAHIVKIRKDKTVFLLVIHHIAGDGISVQIIMDELSQVYNSLTSGDKNFKLKPLKIQYKDYCTHEQNLLESYKYRKEKEYWLSKLQAPIPVLDLPTDRMRPSVKTYNGKYLFSKIDDSLSQNLMKFSKENNVSPFMVLLASVNILLYKYTSQEDIIVGSPVAGRNHPELEDQVGPYINTIALRNNINSHKSFIDFLEEVKTNSSEAFSNSNYPFDKLIQNLNIERDTSRTPLFDVLIQYQKRDVTTLTLKNLKSSFYMVDFTASKFDLTFAFSENNGEIDLNIEYNIDLFDLDRIERTIGHLLNILTRALNNPKIYIKDIDILDKAEEMKILKMSDGTSLKLDEKTVIDLFEEQVKTTPDSIALVFNDKELSYEQLDRKANEVANEILRNTQVTRDDIIAIMTSHSELMVIGILGILKTGAAFLPINQDIPIEQISFMLQDSRTKLLLTERSLLKQVEEITDLVNSENEDKVVILDISIIEEASFSSPRINLAPPSLAYVIYTSGSTETPKGVMIEHRSLYSLIHSLKKNIYSRYSIPLRELLSASFSFDVTVKQLFAALCCGNTLHILDDGKSLAIDEIIEYILNNGINVVFLTPSLLSVMLEAGFGEADKSDFKELYLGAEALPYKLIEKFLSSENNSGVNIYNFYGHTECCVESTLFKILPERLLNDNKKHGTVPIGTPIFNNQIFILDKDLNLCPIGIPGEIYIAGNGLARGYLNDNEKTNERFFDLPLLKEKRVYKTGDMGVMCTDGNIEFLGRIDDKVKVRGYRIELQEIEKHLRDFEEINASTVVLINNKGENEIAAYFTSGGKPEISKIKSYLGLHLPTYMMPQHFIQVDVMPLSSTGKVNKKMLPAPDSVETNMGNIANPSSILEKELSNIWKDLLNVDEISIHDDFFDLGGHSLTAVRLSIQIQKKFNINLKVWEIFQHPTIASLSEFLKGKNSTLVHRIEKIKKGEYYPLSHSQRRMWLLSKLEGNDSLYNIPVVLRLDGKLNFEALEKSFNMLIQRHETLRTSFFDIDGEPYQKIEEKVSSGIEIINPTLEQISEEEITKIAEENSSAVFDLSHAPLLNVKLIRISDTSQILLINMHHIISDGWSFEVIFKELGIYYHALVNEKKAELPQLRIQYKDFAAWQNKILDDNSLEEIKDYWHKKLSSPRPQTGSPIDFKRPEKYNNDGDLIIEEIDKKLSKSLIDFSIRHKASLYMTMLTAVNILLHKYTSEQDIIIGSPVAGRDHEDLENQIGFFVNTLVLRNEVNPECSFLELLNSVKATSSEAIDNQIYPFDKLVDELDVERSLNRNPLFDVMVSWINGNSTIPESLRDIKITNIDQNLKKSKFDLSFIFEENTQHIRFAIEYNSSLFKPSTIRRICNQFTVLLKSVIINPKVKIRDISILTNEEKSRLLFDFNDTFRPLPEKSSVIELFESSVERRGASPALSVEGKNITYEELNRFSNKIANYLVENISPKKDDIIAVITENPVNSVAAMLAIMKSGAAYLPVINSLPRERTDFILYNSGCRAILTDSDFTFADRRVIDIRNIESIKESNPNITIDPDSLAYIIYTSGSTGIPKGVAIEHKSLNSLIFSLNSNIYSRYTEPLNELMVTSFAFDVSVKQIFATLCSGNCLHILNQENYLNPEAIIKYIQKKKIVIVDFTPSLFSALLDEGFAEADKSALKELFIGSEALPYKPVIEFLSLKKNRDINVYNFYGPTECCVESTFYKFDSNEKHNYDITPIGKPILNEQIYILDSNLNLCPIGATGEICIAGDGLARGYLNDKVKTEEKFIDFPMLKGTRIYRTGDLGKISADGNIEFLGRMDNQVKVRGYRIELLEIEKVLRGYTGITDAIVTVYMNNKVAELAAYYTSDSKLAASDIKSYLVRKLPGYMIPGYIIQIDNIPLSHNGKVDKNKLPDPTKNVSTGEEFKNPTTTIEVDLLGIWQEVLGIEKISVYDNFFDLGGNSFLLVKLHKKISSKYPDKLKITDLFSKSKIIEQAEYISEQLYGKIEPKKKASQLNVSRLKYHDIAIIGMAAKIGNCESVDEFWQDLRLGIDFIESIPEERIPDIKEWCVTKNIETESIKFRDGCFLRDIDKFDYGFFKLSPGEASLIDPGQRLFLEIAYNAFEDAGYGGKKLWGSRTGVYIGGGGSVIEYSKIVEIAKIEDTNALLISETPSILAGRISYLLNLKGPAMLVDTACSSSLSAVHLACQSLREGKIDLAVAGSVKLNLLPIDTGLRTEIDSDDGRAHSFDDSANGTGGGEGVIAILLKPLEKALEDKDNIYAVIKGSSLNQDGNSNGLTAPDADAQADVMEQAWLDAGIDPVTVSFIETHGTGTKLGDPIEIDGITKAFKRYTEKTNFCAIGAVKANIGHLDNAAGLAGLLKVVLSLQYKELTPLTHFKNPNRNINFEESAAYVNRELSEWKPEGFPRRCGVSSFGLSGTNCHILLEEAPKRSISKNTKVKKHLFTLSARDRETLLDYLKKVKHCLYQYTDSDLLDICYTLSTGRGHYSHRVAIIFETRNELIEKLTEAYDNNLTIVIGRDIFSSSFRIAPSNRKNISENEITENDLRKISDEINTIIKNTSADEEIIKSVAEAYTKGADILWEDFYSEEILCKVSLPGYPFEKNRCWVKLNLESGLPNKISGTQPFNVYGKKYENIFLQNCIIDTPASSVYSTLYNENTWQLLREYKVMGNPSLVGTTNIQIAYEAGKTHLVPEGLFEDTILFIDELLMLQPVTLYNGSGLEAITTVNKNDGESLSVEVHSKLDGDEWRTYTELKIRTQRKTVLGDELPERLDIEEIKSRMTYFRHVDIINNDYLYGNILQVSEKWHCLNKVYSNDDEFLGKLSISGLDSSSVEAYAFYPPLIDAAISFGVAESGFLPYSFGKVELRGPISGNIYSYIQKKERSSKEISIFDITITDINGKILAIFTDCKLKKVGTLKLDNFFHELTWKRLELEIQDNVVKNNNTLILYNDDAWNHYFEKMENGTCINLVEDSDEEIFKRIFQKQAGEVPKNIIYFLPELYIDDINGCDILEDLLNKSLYSVFNFSRYISTIVSSKMDILFVGKNVSEVTGNETRLSSLNMAVSGLSQVLQMENPNIRCRFLDIDEHTSIQEIYDELNRGFNESYYYRAVRNSERFIRELKPVNPENKTSRNISIKEGEVYIITGGTGGIGLELADYLAEQNTGIKLALLNRSEFPSERDWDKILIDRQDEKLCRKIEKLCKIENNKAFLKLYSTDVSNYNQLENTINEIKKELGEVRGVIHCAGLPGDGFIYRKTIDTFRNVVSPKIQGTVYLAQLLADDKLDFFIMASSLTGLLPPPGQSDYASANLFLDAYASELKRKGVNALSIDFTAWKETGMAFDFNVVEDGIFKSVSTEDAISAFGKIIQCELNSVLFGELDFSLVEIAEFPFYVEKYLFSGRKIFKPSDKALKELKVDIILKGKDSEDYSEYEKVIAKIWAEVLGYKEINIFDNYYDLGGDSIHAIKIISRVEKELGIQIGIGDLFRYLTITELAAFLEAGTDGEERDTIEIIPVEKSEKYPASSNQLQFYMREINYDDKIISNITEIWHLKGKLDIELFRTALNKLIERHDSLRTSFSMIDNVTFQFVREKINFSIPFFTMTEEEAKEYICSFNKPFDLGTAPLIRIEIIKIAPERHLLLFNGHHIILDAFSMNIIISNLADFYNGIELEPLKNQYKEYSAWQRKYFNSELAERNKAYWLTQFNVELPQNNIAPRHTLPHDRSKDAGAYLINLGEKLYSEVKGYSAKIGLSIFNIILTAVYLLTSKFYRHKDITLGVAEVGRDKEEFSGLIGCFRRVLHLRTFLDDATTIEDFLHKVNNIFIEGMKYKEVNYNELIVELRNKGLLKNNDLYNVGLSYMHFESSENKMGDIEIEPYFTEHLMSINNDLIMFGNETDNNLYICFKYKKSIWNQKDIEVFGKHFIRLVEIVTSEGNVKIGQIELINSDGTILIKKD